MNSRTNETGHPHGTWSDYYDPEYSLPLIHRHLQNLGPFVEKCQAHSAGQRLLEIGTGTGIVAVYLSQLGYNVLGLDYDAQILRRNQDTNCRFGGSARFVQGDLFQLPFADGAFDLCYHQGLMEHFDAPQIVSALKAQVRICAKVLFTVPTIRWKGGLFGDERLWSGHRWRSLLQEFRVVDVFGGAYTTFVTRSVNFAGRKVTHGKPTWLYRQLALTRAGEIGFVIERR